MLDSLSTFPPYFFVSWACWLAWILYAYGIFVIVAFFYFGYIRRSMKRVAGLESKVAEQVSLRRAWWFATLTSALVTVTGLIYAGAAFYLTVWTGESLTSKTALEVETLLSL